jgi:CzcA family heavy metal efflux pump
MRWIVSTSLKFRYLVVFAAALMLFFGLLRLREMPVDVFPEFAPPLVEIQTEGPGMSTEEVEELITIQLEQALSGTPGLDVMRSKSVPGLSSIRLIFNSGTDQLMARQLVNERLSTVQSTMPRSAGWTYMLPPLSSTSRVMKIGISSKQLDLMDLSMTTYWTIRFRLLQVPGVANVAIWGERIKMLTVQADPERMRSQKVSLDTVMETTSDALEVGLLQYTNAAKTRTGGFLDTANQRFEIQHVLPVVGPADLARVPVSGRTHSDGSQLRLGDVSKVVWDTWPLIGDAVINDGPGLLLIVEKFPWGNTLEVTRGVEKALAELKPGLKGIDIDTAIFRPATFVEISLKNLGNALLIGALLVVFILAAFLYEWRAALISVIAIPLSLVAGGLVLEAMGASINVMVLAGFVIAVGAVVDDAIIDVENIVRRLRQARAEAKPYSVASVILEASLEVRSAITYATLIIVVAVLPVFFLEGLSGAFFEPLALSYALALLASMVVALTVTPALGLMLLAGAPHRQSPLLLWMQRGYERTLSAIIRTPRWAYLTVGVTGLVGVTVWPMLGQELLPKFKERDFLMHWLTKPGTSHPEMYRITVQASKELRSIPGVRNFGAHIGRAVAADEVVGMYFTENWISVDPKVDYDKTLHAIQETVDGYPGLVRDVQTYLKERIKEVLTGSSESIVVRIFGPDLHTLRAKAAEVQQALEGIEGVVDLHTELQLDIPHVQVKPDLVKIQSYGLKPGDIRRAAGTLVAGNEVSDIHRDNKVYDVWVWSDPKIRNSLTSIRELLIDTPRGGHVRLDEVSDVRILPTPNVVQRENQSRRISVEANVRGRDLGSVAREVQARLAKVQFPLEYNAVVLGEYAERQAAQQRILVFGIMAAIGIFFLLQAAFQNWRLATLVFVTLPMALVGGVLAAWAGSGVLTLGSLVGFLTVFGIAARNGIMMVNHYQHLEEKEGQAFGPELVLRGAKERLAPILMTSGALGLALVPLIVAGSIPGHEIEHPMAIVILGGLVTSTLLNLFVIPSLYLRFGKASRVQMAEG